MGTPSTPHPAAAAPPDSTDAAAAGSRLPRRRLIGGAAAGLIAAGGWLAVREPATPWYINAGPENVRASYAYAVARPAVLRHIPCYCDCGRRHGHGSVLDCFVAGYDVFGRPRYNDHGVGCNLCVAVVQDTATRIAAGATLAQTRAEIDAFYAPYASYATDTALPPNDHG